MSENAEKFTGRVAEYVLYRERYDPNVLLPVLREWCGLAPEWIVADVGAGTGMLSDVFLANGNSVIAVEPNAEMRAACAQLREGFARLKIVDGTAEATGLESSSVDMVSAGRALHWFDLDASMREFRRVLKPGGWFAVVAFGRSDKGREENEAYEKFLRPFDPRGEVRQYLSRYERLAQIFADGEMRHLKIPGEMQVDWEELRGLTLSISYAPLSGDPRFADFESALRDYFARYERNGKVTLSTAYWINAGRFGDSGEDPSVM